MYYLCVFANKIYLEALCRSPKWVNCRNYHPLQITTRMLHPRDIPVGKRLLGWTKGKRVEKRQEGVLFVWWVIELW